MNMSNFGKNLNIKRREDKPTKPGTKARFIELVTLFDELDKRSIELSSFGIQLTDYEDAYFTLVENMMLDLFGDWKTELVMWFVYDRMDEEGTLMPLLVTDESEEEGSEEEVYIENAEQLWDFIKKIDKKPKK